MSSMLRLTIQNQHDEVVVETSKYIFELQNVNVSI